MSTIAVNYAFVKGGGRETAAALVNILTPEVCYERTQDPNAVCFEWRFNKNQFELEAGDSLEFTALSFSYVPGVKFSRYVGSLQTMKRYYESIGTEGMEQEYILKLKVPEKTREKETEKLSPKPTNYASDDGFKVLVWKTTSPEEALKVEYK